MSIHPTSIIGSSVHIDKTASIGPFCHITGYTIISANTHIIGHASIGTPPEQREFYDDTQGGVLFIGPGCMIREFVTINAGIENDTNISGGCIFLKGAHVGHGCYLEPNVTMGVNAVLAGDCYIQEGATLGLGVLVHQKSVIGAYSMLGMGTIVTKQSMMVPGALAWGNPAKVKGSNVIGLERSKVTRAQMVTFLEEFHNHRMRLQA